MFVGLITRCVRNGFFLFSTNARHLSARSLCQILLLLIIINSLRVHDALEQTLSHDERTVCIHNVFQ